MTIHHTELLIPWYVNGTLDEQDMAFVQKHLDECSRCRESVAAEVRRAQQLHRRDDDARLMALSASREDAFEALRSRIRPTPPRLAHTSRFVPTLAALLVLILPVTFVAMKPAPMEERVFETRTASSNVQEPVLQLVFEPDTSAEDIALLISASGEVIGGPTQHGVYRIVLPTDEPGKLLARIRQHPAVRWAEIEQ